MLVTKSRFFILVFLVIQLIIVQYVQSRSLTHCTINIRQDLNDFAPLLLNSSAFKFVYPRSGEDSLQLREGESLDIFCPGKHNRLNVTKSTEKHAQITCRDGQFSLSIERNKKLPIQEIKCIDHPQSFVNKNYFDGNINFPACMGQMYAVGFSVPDGSFLKTFEVCLNDKMQNPFIAYSDVYPILNGQQKRTKKNMWFKTTFLNGQIAKAYTKFEQKNTFKKIFGQNLSDKYITPSIYLQRGHLAARADFFYQSQQVSSYYYLNVVPMWSVINGGNWALLEGAVRQLSSKRGQTLQVWTGSFGILELENESQKSLPIYLLRGSSVPVPKYLFKIVYEGATNQAVVFVMVNNPFLRILTKDDILCNEVTHKITWVKWKLSNTTEGLSYACTYDDFQNIYDVIPSLNVAGLLTGV